MTQNAAARRYKDLQWEMERLNRDWSLETDIGRIELGHKMNEVRRQMGHCRRALDGVFKERATKLGLGIKLGDTS